MGQKTKKPFTGLRIRWRGKTKKYENLTVKPGRGNVQGNHYTFEEIAKILEGDIEEYIEKNGDNTITPPQNHDFDTTYFAEMDGTLENGYGLGFSEKWLKTALSVVTQKKQYNPNNYQITFCRTKPAVIQGPERSILVRPRPVGKPRKSLRPETEINGIEVEEANPEVIEGIKRILKVLPDLGIQITQHSQSPHTYQMDHVFETETGKEFRADAGKLEKIGGSETPRDVFGDKVQDRDREGLIVGIEELNLDQDSTFLRYFYIRVEEDGGFEMKLGSFSDLDQNK